MVCRTAFETLAVPLDPTLGLTAAGKLVRFSVTANRV
jgi:hypothetical protein